MDMWVDERIKAAHFQVYIKNILFTNVNINYIDFKYLYRIFMLNKKKL